MVWVQGSKIRMQIRKEAKSGFAEHFIARIQRAEHIYDMRWYLYLDHSVESRAFNECALEACGMCVESATPEKQNTNSNTANMRH